MATKFMLGIEAESASGATRGVGYNITFEGSEAHKGFQSDSFQEWRKQVKEIVLRHRDDVFDPAQGEANTRKALAEIMEASQAHGVAVCNDGDVPALQISGIDARNNKKGMKLNVSLPEADHDPASIESSSYSIRYAQGVARDGTGGISRPEKKNFSFRGPARAL